MLTIFWDPQDPVFCDFREDQLSTINSQHSSDVLEHKAKPDIKSKSCGLMSKGIILLHDNAGPHTTQLTSLSLNVLPHPAYSQDYSPTDIFCLNHSKTHYVKKDLPTSKKPRRRCNRSFQINQKLLAKVIRKL